MKSNNDEWKRCPWDKIQKWAEDPVHTGICVAEKSYWKGHKGSGGKQAEQKVTLHCCNSKGKSDPGLHL